LITVLETESKNNPLPIISRFIKGHKEINPQNLEYMFNAKPQFKIITYFFCIQIINCKNSLSLKLPNPGHFIKDETVEVMLKMNLTVSIQSAVKIIVEQLKISKIKISNYRPVCLKMLIINKRNRVPGSQCGEFQ